MVCGPKLILSSDLSRPGARHTHSTPQGGVDSSIDALWRGAQTWEERARPLRRGSQICVSPKWVIRFWGLRFGSGSHAN